MENVPYRILSPFIKRVDKKIWNFGEKKLAEAINKQPHLMYYFVDINSLYSSIEIQPAWIEYIKKSSAIILGWIYYEMVDYLQKRNPNVPGIPNKLYPAQERQDISKAKKYWKAVVRKASAEGNPVIDIYGNIPLEPEKIVIDHFIPWSYLAHDELWNLNPTIQTINSSKGNNLPDWNRYVDALCKQEYGAYQIRNNNQVI